MHRQLIDDEDLKPCEGGACPWRLRCWRYTTREQNRRPPFPAPPFRIGKDGAYCGHFLEASGGPWLTPPWQ